MALSSDWRFPPGSGPLSTVFRRLRGTKVFLSLLGLDWFQLKVIHMLKEYFGVARFAASVRIWKLSLLHLESSSLLGRLWVLRLLVSPGGCAMWAFWILHWDASSTQKGVTRLSAHTPRLVPWHWDPAPAPPLPARVRPPPCYLEKLKFRLDRDLSITCHGQTTDALIQGEGNPLRRPPRW